MSLDSRMTGVMSRGDRFLEEVAGIILEDRNNFQAL